MMAPCLYLCAALLTGATDGPVTSTRLYEIIERVRLDRVACGPISAWFCLRRLGHDVSLETILQEAPLTDVGISVASLQILLQRRHSELYAAHYDQPAIADLPVPAIVIINDRHCVVYDGPGDTPGSVLIFEPSLQQHRTVPADELLRAWSGDAIVFENPSRAANNRRIALVMLAGATVILGGLIWRGRRSGRLPQQPAG